MAQDTIHLLFPGLNKLLNFQRKFLIRLESIAEVAWKDQRWGLHFMENVSPSHVLVPTLYAMLNSDIPLCLLVIVFTNNRKKNSLFTNLTVAIIPMLPN